MSPLSVVIRRDEIIEAIDEIWWSIEHDDESCSDCNSLMLEYEELRKELGALHQRWGR